MKTRDNAEPIGGSGWIGPSLGIIGLGGLAVATDPGILTGGWPWIPPSLGITPEGTDLPGGFNPGGPPDVTPPGSGGPAGGTGTPRPWPPPPKKPPGPVYVPPQNSGKEGVARVCSALAVVYGLFVVGAFYAQAEKNRDSLGPLVSGAILAGATAPMVYATCYFLAPG